MSRETHQLTDGTVDAIAPVWDESGKYLYFLASADYALNTGWLDMTSYDRPVTRDVESGGAEHVDTDRYAHPQRSLNPL